MVEETPQKCHQIHELSTLTSRKTSLENTTKVGFLLLSSLTIWFYGEPIGSAWLSAPHEGRGEGGGLLVDKAPYHFLDPLNQKFLKTSIFLELFFQKYDNFKIISVRNISLSSCLELHVCDWSIKEKNYVEYFGLF